MMKQRVYRIGSAGFGTIYIKAEVKDERLSISGVEGPHANGSCDGSCGQIYDTLKSPDLKLNKDWTTEMVAQLRYIWTRWHLNDMRAGCEHQRELGWTKYDEHPSEPCPVCGYKYGTQWLKEDLPESVVSVLEAFPETTVTPAWV